MVDMSKTIVAKSDQLNADDLIGQSLTIRVTGVSLLAGEQPVGISYEGDNGKPYKPCKSMRRVLVGVWGMDGSAYIGRSMTLYRDETVLFGGAEVGGIRISHLSGIDKPVTMSLAATRKSKKPFTVRPLVAAKGSAASDANTFWVRVETALGWFRSKGATDADVFRSLQIAGTEDMTVDLLGKLTWMRNAIKGGDEMAATLFPPPQREPGEDSDPYGEYPPGV